MDRIILHADMNCFYASVEIACDPSLRGKPLAVAGDAEKRHGIILTKTYEAKRCGVQTGQPIWQALRCCPELILKSPDFEKYAQYSKKVRRILQDYTDQVEPFGLDECWLDVTGSVQLLGTGREIADKIRRRIWEELQITASVGVSFNKVFAKLGSDYRKPDATTEFTRENFREKIWPLPVESLLYVGRATATKLNNRGIRTIGQLANTEPEFLSQLLGVNGRMLWEFANGMDAARVMPYYEKLLPKSIGNSTTTPRDLVCDQDVRITMRLLCESVAMRLRKQESRCKVVQIWLRDANLHSKEKQVRLPFPTNSSDDLLKAAWLLYLGCKDKTPLRSVGVRAVELEPISAEQKSFLPEEQQAMRREQLERTLDRVRGRYGFHSVCRALLLRDPQLSDLDPEQDHLVHPQIPKLNR